MLQDACKRSRCRVFSFHQIEGPPQGLAVGAGGETELLEHVTDARSTILNSCRVLGWWLAAAITIAPAFEIAGQLHKQRIRRTASKREFMVKVRNCVHDRSGPPRSWEVCEVVARGNE
jgi:hypothetical protein